MKVLMDTPLDLSKLREAFAKIRETSSQSHSVLPFKHLKMYLVY